MIFGGRVRVICGFAVVSLYVAGPAAAADDERCQSLLSLTNDSFSVLNAEVIRATASLPQHCRIHVYMLPAINFEVRLSSEWNGKFYMVGNGGYLGEFFDQSYGLA